MAKFHLIAQIIAITVCLVPKFLCNSTNTTTVVTPAGNGKPVSNSGCQPADYPYLVLINDNSSNCMGSLIEPNIVLTTGMCAGYAQNVSTTSQTPEIVVVQDKTIHDSYRTDNTTDLNNIGLLKLKTPLNGGLVKLPEANVTKTCKPLKVAGVGTNCFDVTFVDGNSCAITTKAKETTNFVDLSFCAQPLDNKTEFKFSGAPLVCNGSVLGLAVHTTTYVKVYGYLEYIENAKKKLMAPKGQPRANATSAPTGNASIPGNASVTTAEATPGVPLANLTADTTPDSSGNRVWAQSLNWNLLYAILTLLVNLLEISNLDDANAEKI